MADKQSTEEQKRSQEISRLKRLNTQIKNRSQSKNKTLDKSPQDSMLFGLFDMFKLG